MTQYLPPNLLALFAPRDPIPYLPPVDKLPYEKNTAGYSGIAQYLKEFEDPAITPDPVRIETRDERQERKRREKAELGVYKLEQDIALWQPQNNPSATMDPFKTLFVARVNYDTSESKLRREFEQFGLIKKIALILNNDTKKPRGYAFIEYEHERCMRSAYKHADGKKIDGRRVLVDIERGRTIKGWLPRRLGGGLGGTRRGGPDMNLLHSGREESRMDDRYRERDRERGGDRGGERGGERGGDRGERMERPERERRRSRSKSRERRRRSRSRSRERVDRGDRHRDRGDRHKRDRSRDRNRDRPNMDPAAEKPDGVPEVAIDGAPEGAEPTPRKERRRSRSRDRERRKERSRRSRSRDRKRRGDRDDRDRDGRRGRDGQVKIEKSRDDDKDQIPFQPIAIKEEPVDESEVSNDQNFNNNSAGFQEDFNSYAAGNNNNSMEGDSYDGY